MKQKGFSLLELMIVVAIIGIFASIIFSPKQHKVRVEATQMPVQYGNMKIDCIEGYKWLISEKETKQILNERGGGVSCRK